MKRRFLAMLLSLAMVLTMLPVSAFAAVSLEGQSLTVVATSDDQDNKTVKVTTLETTANPSVTVSGNVYYSFLSSIPNEVPTSITVGDNGYKQITVDNIKAGTDVTRTDEHYIAVATLQTDATTGDQTPTAWGIALIDEPTAIDNVSVGPTDRKITGITVGSDTYKYKVFAADADIDVITTKTTIASLTEADGWTTMTSGDNTLPKAAAGTLVVVKAEQNAETVSAIATVEDVEAAAYTALTVTVSNDGKVEVKEGAEGTALDTSGFSFYKVATDKQNWSTTQNWNAATKASDVVAYFEAKNELTLSTADDETKDVLTSALAGEMVVAIRTAGTGDTATLDAIGMSAAVTYTPPAAPTELTVTVDTKTNAVTVTKPGASQEADPETVNHTNLLFFKATDKNSWSSENWNTDTDITAVESAWTSNKLELTNDGKLPDTMTTEAYVIAVEKATDKLAGIGETTDKVKYNEPELEIGEVTVGTTDNVITHSLTATSGESTIKYALADKAFTGPVTAKTVWDSEVLSSTEGNKVVTYSPTNSQIDSTATGKYLIAAVVKDTEGTVVSIACTTIPVSYYDAAKQHVTVTKDPTSDDNITILTPSVEVAGTAENQGTATIKVTATAGYQPVVVSVNSTTVDEADAAKYKFTAGSNNEYTLNLTGLSISQDTAIVIKSEAIKYTVTVSTTDDNVTIVSPAAVSGSHVATVTSGETATITVDVKEGFTPTLNGTPALTLNKTTGADTGEVRWTVTIDAVTANASYTVTTTEDGTSETFNVTVTTNDTTNVKIVSPAADANGDHIASVAKNGTTEIIVDVAPNYTPASTGLSFDKGDQTDVTTGMVRWTTTTPAVTANVSYEITASQTPTVETFDVTVTTADDNVKIIVPAANASGAHVAAVAKDATATITVDVTENYTPASTNLAFAKGDQTGVTTGKVRWTATTPAVTADVTFAITASLTPTVETFDVTVTTEDDNVEIIAPAADANGAHVVAVEKGKTTVITVDVTEGYTPASANLAFTKGDQTGATQGMVRWTATTPEITAATTYTVTATKDEPGNTTVEGNPNVSDDGTATGEVDTSDIDEVLNNATGTTDQIELDFSTPAGTTKPDDVKKTEIAIPTEAVESINDYNEEAKKPGSNKKEVSLSVKTPIGTVTVGSDVVEEMTKDSTFTDDKGQTVTPDATTEAKVVLNVEKVEVPVASGETAPAPDEKQAFEIHFEKKLVRKGSDTVLATAPVEVKNTTVTITVATTVQPKPGANTLIAAFVDGVKKTVVDWAARYDSDSRNATFTTPHLSTFVLMAERDNNTPSGIEIVDKNGNAVDLDDYSTSGNALTIEAGGKLVLPSTITASNRVNVKYESGAWVLIDTTKNGTLSFEFEGTTYTATLQASAFDVTATAMQMAGETTHNKLAVTDPDENCKYVIRVKFRGKLPNEWFMFTSDSGEVIVPFDKDGYDVEVYEYNNTVLEPIKNGSPVSGYIRDLSKPLDADK